MCCSPTVAMEMSSTSMTAASPPVGATTQGLTPARALDADAPEAVASAIVSAHLHARHHRHARAERATRVERIVEHDLDGDALHHLDVVARRILRRQQAEGGAAAGLEACDMAVEGLFRIGVDADVDRLPGAHEVELRLLEIGGDPQRRRAHHHEALPHLHQINAGYH